MGGDDGTEVDGGHGTSASTTTGCATPCPSFLSILFWRPPARRADISINIGRTPFKWKQHHSGQFIYNNTMLRTLSNPGSRVLSRRSAGCISPKRRPALLRLPHNILIYRGVNTPLQTIPWTLRAHPVDFTHNSWFPDAIFQWPENRYLSLTEARNNLPATTRSSAAAPASHQTTSR